MSTPIVPVPDVVLASEFPTLADRPAGTYNAKAAAWANSENAMAQSVREVALTVQNNAIATDERAGIADAAAVRAEAAANSAQQSAGATEWESGKTYAAGEVVWSPIDFQSYRRRTAGSSTIDPSEDAATWELLGGGGAVDPSPAGDFTAQANKSYWLRGSFTVTLPPSPSLGNQVSFFKALDATPTIVSDGPLIQTPKGSDTSVLFDLDAEITFTFNGTDWEV